MAPSTLRGLWKPSTVLRRAATLCALSTLVWGSPAHAQLSWDPSEPAPAGDPLFSLESPIGPLEYRAGRGLRFGNIGLNVGGFTTVEFDREDGEPGELTLDGINVLVLLQPIDLVRGFAEIEIGDLFAWTTDKKSVDSDVQVDIERLYADLSLDDSLNVRFGKFQTPVGRWNLVPAEPFVWTPTEPVVVETAFDEHQTGGAVLGSFYPAAGTLDYWIYGQFLDPLDPSDSPDPADRSVGGRLEFDRLLGQWSVGASFLASERKDAWSYLGGIDAEWQIGRLNLTGEFTIQEGKIEDRDLWDVYVQGVYEAFPSILPNVYLVGRFEHFDPSGANEDSDLGDLGVAWIPRPYLHFKLSYRMTDNQSDEVRRGLSVSFSVIF